MSSIGDVGHNALVPVTSGHLVAHSELALNRDIDLDHLDHAGRQVVSFRYFFALGFVQLLNEGYLGVILVEYFGNFVINGFSLKDSGKFFDRDTGEILGSGLNA
jgi:hypothetical protein